MKDCLECRGTGKIKDIYDSCVHGQLLRKYADYIVKNGRLITGIDIVVIDNFLIWYEMERRTPIKEKL